LLDGVTPAGMILDICGNCNAACPFCPRVHMPAARAKGYMSDEVFNTALDEAETYGIKNIRLYATAEPTLHPKFDEYVEVLKSRGFNVTVSTNAFTLNRHFDSLSKIDCLQYSIEGWDKNSYEKFRYPLKFEKVHDNIVGFWRHISQFKTRPKINCNLLATKEVNFDQYFNCWADYVDEVRISPLMTTTRFSEGRFISELNPDIADKYFEFEMDYSRHCSYPFGYVSVTFDGKIALCCADFSAELDLGYIKDGISSWITNSRIKIIRREFYPFRKKKICKDCNYFCVPTEQTQSYIRSLVEVLPEHYVKKASLVF